jgi:membrane protein
MAGEVTLERSRTAGGLSSPWDVFRADWKGILKRTWTASGNDNIGLIAAGTAFWSFAAIAPLLGAIVLSYGLFATPQVVADDIRELFGVLPRDAAALIADQLKNAVSTSSGKKGVALAFALLLALYGGSQGASAIITALNIAYEERETRGFFRLYRLAFAITGAGVLLGIGAALSTTATQFLGSLLPATPEVVKVVIRVANYLVLGAMTVTVAALLYRYGPDRKKTSWRWLTPGSLLATLLWLPATAGFAFYVANFGSYNVTYGSLGAVVVLQIWLWLSAYIFLLGAELNATIERRKMPGDAPSTLKTSSVREQAG